MDLIERIAIAQSATTGKEVWYGIIDGKDSERLRLAYPKHFETKKRAKAARPAKKRTSRRAV